MAEQKGTPSTLKSEKYSIKNSPNPNSIQDSEEVIRNIHSILKHMPGAVVWKDEKSTFLGCNDFAANLGGLISSEDIIGKTDHDMVWGSNSYADSFVEQDIKTLEGEVRLNIGRYQYADGKYHTMLIKKFPLLNAFGQTVGSISALTEVSKASLYNIIEAIKHFGIEIKDQKLIRLINERYTDENYRLYLLTPKDKETLFYLVRGYSANDIAKTISLSPRTVEDRIDRLKEKFNCPSKRHLMEYLFDTGIVYQLMENRFAKKNEK